jgi:isopenicillin-N epimerase
MRSDLGWSLDPDWTFLNHGSFGACPDAVLADQQRWRARLERQPVRFLDRELPGLLVDARRRVGAFFGGDPDGLAFVPNATTGVNAVLRSLTFAPGDELLTTDHEYNATINAMRAVAEPAGARVVVARIPVPVEDDAAVVEAVLAALTPRTRLLVISHVTSPTALILPVARLVRQLTALGVDTLVDGAHAPGLLPLALDDLGAAYYTGNGHKWLCAPKGAAFLWVRADRRDRIRAPITSHGANDPSPDVGPLRKAFDWLGTGDPTPALTLPDAIDRGAAGTPGGWPARMAASRAMALQAGERLRRALGVMPLAPDAMLGAMVAVRLPGPRSAAEGHALKASLEAARIEVPIVDWPVRAARHDPDDPPDALLLRVSTPPYVEARDIDRLLEVLAPLLAKMSGSSSGAHPNPIP